MNELRETSYNQEPIRQEITDLVAEMNEAETPELLGQIYRDKYPENSSDQEKALIRTTLQDKLNEFYKASQKGRLPETPESN